MGFGGGGFERAFFDVRVLSPHAPTNCRLQLSSCYRSHENAKKRCEGSREGFAGIAATVGMESFLKISSYFTQSLR